MDKAKILIALGAVLIFAAIVAFAMSNNNNGDELDSYSQEERTITLQDGSIAAGRFAPGTNNLVDGTITFPTGELHQGLFTISYDGTPVLVDGTITTPEGDTVIIEDNFDGDIIHLDRRVVMSDGSIAEGTFLQGTNTLVEGTITFPSGETHSGIFTLVNNLSMLVDGIITTSDGNTFEGQFSEHNGLAMLTNGLATTYTGETFDGLFNIENGINYLSDGVKTLQNGETHAGTFILLGDNISITSGTISTPSGDIFTGSFDPVLGLITYGSIHFADGSSLEGTFDNSADSHQLVDGTITHADGTEEIITRN